LQDEAGEPENGGELSLEVSMVVTNAQIAWSELLVLNGNCRPSKREELETRLDRSILALSRVARRVKNVKKQDLKPVINALWSIRDYRLRFPRSSAANPELSERAQQVLNELQ